VVLADRGDWSLGENVARLKVVSESDPAAVHRIAFGGKLLPCNSSLALVAPRFESGFDSLLFLVQYPAEDVTLMLKGLKGNTENDLIVKDWVP
jgi:hypothetical protein